MAFDIRGVARFNRREGATDSAIANSEKQLNATLPQDYIEFLKVTNGGDGFVGTDTYILFWRVGELASMNQSYDVHKYAPGLILFGSDGAGEAYGFDTRDARWSIVQVPFVGMDWRSAEPMSATLDEFLKRLQDR